MDCNDMIVVECKVKLNGQVVSASDILIHVKSANHKQISYRSSELKHYSGPKGGVRHQLELEDEIDFDSERDNNIYFLIDSNNLDILYVGKSLNMSQRLTDHLIDCSESTSSKIRNVSKHLQDNETNTLNYYTLKVQPEEMYGTVEGLLIKYFFDNENTSNWNIRSA